MQKDNQRHGVLPDSDSELPYEIGPCILFNYKMMNSDGEIHLEVSESILNPRQHGRVIGNGEVFTRREVNFVFFQAKFLNDFEALSKVLALITAAEQNSFGLRHKEISMILSMPPSANMDPDGWSGIPDQISAEIFVKKVQFRTLGYGLGLTLGLKTEKRTWSADLPIFWIHHLKNGLKKALNWLKPVHVVKYGDV